MSDTGHPKQTERTDPDPVDAAHSDEASFIAHAKVVAALTVLSRLFGLARDLVLGRILGDTALGSAFAAAFAIPNLFRRLFGEGALAASFVPQYAQLAKHDETIARRFASLTVALLVAFTGALALLMIAVLGLILATATPDPARDDFLRLTMLMLPFMPLVCITAILGGILQVHGRFGPAAAAPILLNTCIIAGALLGLRFVGAGGAGNAAYTVAIAVVIAGALQIAWSLLALRPFIRWTRVFIGTADAARTLRRRFFPALIGMGTLQINTFLDVTIAMWPIWFGPTVLGLAYPLDEASNSILFYSQRLYQFPLGVFGIAVATAIFPALSRTADETEPFLDTLRRGLRLSLFIAVPASIGLMLVREPLVRTLFTGGASAFSNEGAGRAAAVVLAYAPAIWAYSINHVLTRAFYAIGDTTTPMRVSIGVVIVNFALNVALIWRFREAGLAWATTITAIAQCLVLSRLLHNRRGVILDAPTTRSFLSTIGLSLAMGATVYATLTLLPAAAEWSDQLARLCIGVGAGGVTFTLLALLTRRPELRWLLRRD